MPEQTVEYQSIRIHDFDMHRLPSILNQEAEKGWRVVATLDEGPVEVPVHHATVRSWCFVMERPWVPSVPVTGASSAANPVVGCEHDDVLPPGTVLDGIGRKMARDRAVLCALDFVISDEALSAALVSDTVAGKLAWHRRGDYVCASTAAGANISAVAHRNGMHDCVISSGSGQFAQGTRYLPAELSRQVWQAAWKATEPTLTDGGE